MSGRLSLRVTRTWSEARDVLALELRAPDQGSLPPFAAGAHLELALPGGLIRHYSLFNDPAERDRYCIGVGLARESRGGSRYIHEQVRAGQTLSVVGPHNNFRLIDHPQDTLLIAGGIGITPILAMARTLQAKGASWKLIYCARNRQRAAFYEDLRGLAPDRCHFHFDDESAGRLVNIASLLSGSRQDIHIYCCGPAPLMDLVKCATTDWPRGHVHFEWFTPPAIDITGVSNDRPFIVILRSSGLRYTVPPGRSILEVLEDNAVEVPFSCREGLCATCRTPVLDGTPDHRDSVLSDSERAANDQILICVSRAKTDVLELDL